MLTTPVTDFDSPWKEALEAYLEDFFALFLPQAHAEIDWSRRYAFLDKELQQVVRDAEIGRRVVDKLVRVWQRSGEDAWVLVHIEVQSQEEADFARRMFVYFYRLYDRYRRQVVSLAVLGDERAEWRPAQFTAALWGCATQFTFPIVKLLDYRSRQAELVANDNPFATVVLAHLAVQETRGDMGRRQQVKLGLTRRLYERGYSREQVLSLFRFIDWLLALPEEYEAQFWHDVQAYEEERRMPYITSVERRGRAEGELEGERKALRRIVWARFQSMPEALELRIASADQDLLDRLIDRAGVVHSVDELLT